jgi:hypothetical protein
VGIAGWLLVWLIVNAILVVWRIRVVQAEMDDRPDHGEASLEYETTPGNGGRAGAVKGNRDATGVSVARPYNTINRRHFPLPFLYDADPSRLMDFCFGIVRRA